MADFKSDKNLKQLLDLMESVRENKMLSDKEDDLIKKGVETSSRLMPDRMGVIADKGADAVSELKPNFVMRDVAEDMLPARVNNLPDIAGEVIDRSDEVSRALVKSGARTPSTIGKTAGKIASKSLGPALGLAGAVLGEDQVQAATMSPEEAMMNPEDRRNSLAEKGLASRSPEFLADILDAGMEGVGVQDFLASKVDQVPFRPLDEPKKSRAVASEEEEKEPKKESKPVQERELTKEPTRSKSTSTKKAEPEESPLSRYEQLLSDYEKSKKEAGGKDLMVQGVQSLLDAFAQYDLAGGPQYAGLKAKKTRVPDLGFGKQVENKFNKQLQLEGLKRKEKELEMKRKQASDKMKSSGMKLTKGQEARDKVFGKDYAEFANAGGYASVRKNLDTLENVKAKLKDSDLTGGLIERIAPEGVRDAYRRGFDEEAQDIKDQIEQVVQQSLRQTLGAQFTEKEAARLIERSYNTALSPEKNIERLDRTIKELDSMARAKEESGRYFEKYGSLVGYESPLGSKAESRKEDSNIKKYAEDNDIDYSKAERILKARGYKGN